ncbi:uncharacterized protein LOC101854987 [Aplysia californica]|uniref:Uncharacterized protein LOC101854987 n=1 Tax=Aplysia californica TaxID=6500 RepID=A0ABM0K7Q6_APLCA|nr:uncharacterized protein LOC101854987 [Aplysia californica]
MPSFDGIKNHAFSLGSNLFIPDEFEFPPLSTGINKSEYRSVMSPTFCALADEVEKNFCDLDFDIPEQIGGNTNASVPIENVQNVDSQTPNTDQPVGNLEQWCAEAIRRSDDSYDEMLSLSEDLSKCELYSYEMTLLGPIFSKLSISGPQNKAVNSGSPDQESGVVKQASLQHDSQSHTISHQVPTNSQYHTIGHQAPMHFTSQYHTISQQTPMQSRPQFHTNSQQAPMQSDSHRQTFCQSTPILPGSQCQSSQTFVPNSISSPTPLPSSTPLSTTYSTSLSLHPTHHQRSGSPSSSSPSLPQPKPARSAAQRLCNAEFKKPLPWCEFSESHLDDLTFMLMEAHKKHIGKDLNCVSPEEIAEKTEIYKKVCRLKERVFGKKTLHRYREEYYKILESTGVDIDGRKKWMELSVKVTDDILFKTVRFIKNVPGFRDLCKDDRVTLCRGSFLDCFVLASFRGCDFKNRIMIEDSNLAFNINEILGLFPDFDESIIFYLSVTKRIKKLNLTLEEIVLLKAICITSPDRDGLKERQKVEALYWQFLCCLLLSLHRRHPKPYSIYSQVITLLADLKTCVIIDHQLLEFFRMDITKLTRETDAPLYKEMLLYNHPATAY